jgi:hypothetical protein
MGDAECKIHLVGWEGGCRATNRPPFTLLESEMTSPSAGPIGSPRGPRRDGNGHGYAEARCGGVAGPGADRRLRLCEHNNLESMRWTTTGLGPAWSGGSGRRRPASGINGCSRPDGAFPFLLFRDCSLPSLLAMVCAFKCVWSRACVWQSRGGHAGWGAAFEAWHQTSKVHHQIGFGCFLALDFNRDDLLCAFFWVHNGWRLSAEDVFLGGPSIVLIDLL